ncbi:aminotransferase class V-fold PLP-dependent enzyme [Microvirga antarctica]|uniref:aminotransferase class V-fold PLP-dependent enzyme n=1 Tax=Microvirga antarctica TaxID=2819233 RepID=UPI001B303692|nr:aminotransferase class V-fold PLP-dependent enzyme [Microvirga antarctica]
MALDLSQHEAAAERSGSFAAWGRALRPLWGLDPDTHYINHGAFGATPREIGEEQTRWRVAMERNPARFFMTDLPRLLREAAAPLAAFVGTKPDRLAFVENATSGISAVVRSLDLAPGDEILTTDHIYNAARNTLRFVADRTGARLVEAPLGMPVRDDDHVVGTVKAALNARTKLLVIDHVASASAVRLPVEQLVALGRERGIPVLIDGAHAPGLLDLDIDAIGADWYVGNCHKWLCAPKGAAFLAVAERPTPVVHPLAISHAYGQGFTAEFDKVGTRDPSSWLSVPAAIRFHERVGGKRLRQRNRELAATIAAGSARELGTALGAAPQLFDAMATIRLPGNPPATRDEVTRIHDQLWDSGRFETAITSVAGALYLRISVQAYNDLDDFSGLSDALLAALHDGAGAGPKASR